MAKKMIINCGECDARNVSEETLAAYESIVINCGDVLVTPESRALLNRYNVTMNCGSTLEIPAGVKLSKVNGSAQIKSTDEVEGTYYLSVNGNLEIGPDTQKVLEHYVGISVNGTVNYPESMSRFLGMMNVNGSTSCYPDNAIILKRNAIIDRLFALRAKSSLYWSAKRMIMVDPQLDAARLAAKGATFSSKEVILAESKVEDMIELIDEKAQIVIVPDGTAVVLDDLELNELTVKKYGAKLYVIGDVKVGSDAEQVLGSLEYLNVRGDIAVVEALKTQLMAVLTEVSGDVKIMKLPKGRHIEDKMSLRISKWLLEQEKDGICVSDCMKVILDEDIPNELILDKLSISDCMEVKCSPEQEAAVAAVCEDVLAIGGMKNIMGNGEENGDLGIGDMIKGILGGAKDLLNTKVINAGDYVI